MPCGFKDQRRLGHRCLNCRQEHCKCDGNRPCARCQRKGYRCVSVADRSTELAFVAYHKTRRALPTPVSGLKNDGWLHSRLFFDSTCSSMSPVMQIFSFEYIGPIFHSSPLIQDLVSLVGDTYVARQKGLTRPPDRQKHRALRVQVLEKMKNPAPCDFTVVLLAACLLGFVELGKAHTSQGWTYLIRLTRQFALQNSSVPQTNVDTMLDLFARMCDATRCICFAENIPIPDSWMMSLDTDPGLGPQATVPTREAELYRLTHIVELWARLRFCSLAWVSQHMKYEAQIQTETGSSNRSFTPTMKEATVPSDHIVRGIDLVCFASKLQRAIISAMIDCGSTNSSPSPTSNSPATFQPASGFLPYYHWALVGISQTFWWPAWQTLGCALPTMDHVLAQEQAVQALDWVQNRVNHLEAIVLAPVLSIVGAALQMPKEQDRILECVDTLKERGFDVFSNLPCELREIWGFIQITDPNLSKKIMMKWLPF